MNNEITNIENLVSDDTCDYHGVDLDNVEIETLVSDDTCDYHGVSL